MTSRESSEPEQPGTRPVAEQVTEKVDEFDEFDGLSEQEFDDLALLSRFSTLCFALAATTLTVAIGLWIEPDPGMGPASQAESREFLLQTAEPACAIASVLFALFGLALVARRRRILATIAQRQARLDEELHRAQGTVDPALSDSQRSPTRSLMRW